MSRLLQPLLLACCVGLSAGLNHVMRPKFDYVLSASERTLTTGSLVLEQEGRIYRFQLATIHVVAADIARPLASPLPLRALWLRSPEQTGQPVPDVEMLFDIAAGSERPIEPAARDSSLLLGRALPALPKAPGAELRSRMRLPGTVGTGEISAGELVIREALQLQKGDLAQGWRIRADLVVTSGEGEQQRRTTGKVDARLVW